MCERLCRCLSRKGPRAVTVTADTYCAVSLNAACVSVSLVVCGGLWLVNAMTLRCYKVWLSLVSDVF